MTRQVDEHIALQNQDGLNHGLSRGRQRALDAVSFPVHISCNEGALTVSLKVASVSS